MRKSRIYIMMLFVFVLGAFNAKAQKSEKGTLIIISEIKGQSESICNDESYKIIEVNNTAEKKAKIEEFKSVTKGYPVFVPENMSFVVFEYKRKYGGYSCTPNRVVVKQGMNIQACKENMDKEYNKYKNEYYSVPAVKASKGLN